jgi:hypothetical protein
MTEPSYRWKPWILPSTVGDKVLNTEFQKQQPAVEYESVSDSQVSEELLINMLGEWSVSISIEERKKKELLLLINEYSYLAFSYF